MSADIPESLRQYIIGRADNCCEYCLLPQSVTLHKYEPDHIIPNQHGGETKESNLALACMRTNRYKGPNVGSIDQVTGRLVPFFNPRTHSWTDHFKLKDAIIQPITAEARVTVRILHLNDDDRVAERRRLMDVGLYG